jgi:outer membrane protein assembly factor BamB
MESDEKEEEDSWKMFRGNSKHTGTSPSKVSKRPHLQWVIELGPLVASPVVDNGTLYAATTTGRVFAIDILRSKIKWHSNIGSPLVSSPLLYGDLLIGATFDSWVNEAGVLGKNMVFAIDTKCGEQAWSFEIDGDVFSSPCVARDLIIIGSLNKSLIALDINGNLKWDFKTRGEVWSSASFNGDDQIFAGSDDGFLYCLNTDGKLEWRTKLNGKIRSSSLCISECNSPKVFIGTHNGEICCLNQCDGSVIWNKQVTKPVLSSPAVLKERVYFASSDNNVYCFDCNTGMKIWEFATDNKLWSSPAIAKNDGVLFCGSLDSHIYGLDIKTGNQTWKFPTMDIIDSSPCIASNMLFVGGRDGFLYAFGSQNVAPTYTV